jgi:arginyl-tRNA synthetase
MSRATDQPADPAAALAECVANAVRLVTGRTISPEEALIREAAPEHGADYQSNAAMGLAKRLGRPPRALAEELAARLALADIAEPPAVAGPGFINIRLRDAWIAQRLAQIAADERLGVPRSASPRRIVIDYSSPNVAKEMHVGHLRSTIIGDALARLLRFAGHEVILRNHLGDWGTPFGMLIEHMLDSGRGAGAGGAGEAAGRTAGPADGGRYSIADLGAFYQAAQSKFASDPAFAERSRQRVVELQRGDAATVGLWRELVEESGSHFEEVYELLGVLLGPQDIVGESAYEQELAEVAAELQERGLARISEGALCAFPEGFRGRDGEPVPLIVRKRDGAYSYDATDLAALRHRVRELGAQELLYVVGAPQRLHFEMVFRVAREAGWLDGGVRARHVSFGSVLGEDRKMLRTRSGAPVRLVDLLREAIDRAAGVLAERGMQSSPELARTIGIGAVKYADLSSDRERDYVFSLERMLSFEGDTSVYLQYANARARSVLRRAQERAAAVRGSADAAPGPADAAPGPARFELVEPVERALALELLRLPAATAGSLADYRPHRLCGYLHGLAVVFSVFYESCPVLDAQEPVRSSRLALCELVSRAITLGLAQLGIGAPERLSPPPVRPGVAAQP